MLFIYITADFYDFAQNKVPGVRYFCKSVAIEQLRSPVSVKVHLKVYHLNIQRQ